MGSQSRKNIRRHRALVRRKSKEGRSHYSALNPQPTHFRTLRQCARKKLRTEKPYRYIMPWVKDPAYRIDQTNYPDTNLLRIPTELRQKILLETMSSGEIEEATREEIEQRIGDLSCVAPHMRIDMLYVGEKWKEEKLVHEAEQARAQSQCGHGASTRRHPYLGSRTHNYSDNQQKKGEVYKYKLKKVERRPSRCWHCERRHVSMDPVCPLARKDVNRWNAMTKERENWRAYVNGKGNIFKGKKTILT